MTQEPTPALSPEVPNYKPLFTCWGIKSLSRAIAWWFCRGEYRKGLGLCRRIPAAIAWSVRYGGLDACRNDSRD